MNEVCSTRDSLPPVIRAATVTCPPTEAFRVFTDEIGAWWPLPTHGIFGDRSGGVVFRDGRLIEIATDGSEAVWGEITAWDPPRRLAISWHPGRDADDASLVEVSFDADGESTRVTIEHRGWETFGEDAAARRRSYVGPNAWGYVLDHYGSGAAHRPDGADLVPLVDAYDAFFAEYEAGGFGPPDAGEWDADRVLAHVALNDGALLGVCQAIVHGQEARLENEVCQDPDVLDGWIERSGDASAMLERARQGARQVVAALARLSASERATEVHCRLLHDGETMVDGPRPWGAVAIDTQATMHLPAHIEQLRKLRA